MKPYHSNNKANEYSTREIARALGITTKEVLDAERSAFAKLAILLDGAEIFSP